MIIPKEAMHTLRYATRAAYALVVLLWILSVLLTALGRDRDLPTLLRHPSGVARLFTRRVQAWAWFEIQGRFTGGEGRWVPLRVADYSGVENYGYLTRLDRVLDEAGSRERGPRLRRDLAGWIASAHARRFPESPALREVRFLRVMAPVGSELLARPAGRWIRPPLETVPADWVREIAIVTDRQWIGDSVLPSAR